MTTKLHFQLGTHFAYAIIVSGTSVVQGRELQR